MVPQPSKDTGTQRISTLTSNASCRLLLRLVPCWSTNPSRGYCRQGILILAPKKSPTRTLFRKRFGHLWGPRGFRCWRSLGTKYLSSFTTLARGSAVRSHHHGDEARVGWSRQWTCRMSQSIAPNQAVRAARVVLESEIGINVCLVTSMICWLPPANGFMFEGCTSFWAGEYATHLYVIPA